MTAQDFIIAPNNCPNGWRRMHPSEVMEVGDWFVWGRDGAFEVFGWAGSTPDDHKPIVAFTQRPTHVVFREQ